MEVHHHPNVEKKNFKEYFLEFLMIFLAVTMGFFAENIREHIADDAREKEYMQSLVNDLKLDTSYVNTSSYYINERIAAIDTTLLYFVSYSKGSKVPFSIIKQMQRSLWDRIFVEHSGTIDQLRYSGGLRLVHERELVDSIESYYQQISRFTYQRQVYKDNQAKAFDFEDKLWDFQESAKFLQSDVNIGESTMMSVNNSYLNEFLNLLIRLKWTARIDLKNYNTIKSGAAHLIFLIQDKYHLKKE
jgi:hypothetical protein